MSVSVAKTFNVMYFSVKRAMAIQQKKIGNLGLRASSLGFGCMGLTSFHRDSGV